MARRRPDLSSLVALTADCPSRAAYEAARLDWLERTVGFDAFYCGAAEPPAAVPPTVTGISTAFVDQCERRADRYWDDRILLHRAAARHGGAVFDREVLGKRERDRMPFYREVVAGAGIGAIAALLLRARGEAVGCLYLGRAGRGARFGAREIEDLRAAAPVLGLGVALHAPQTAPVPASLAGLSPREREVTTLICRGLTNDEIAHVLGTSPRTVKNQIASVFEKTGTTNRTELAAMAARLCTS